MERKKRSEYIQHSISRFLGKPFRLQSVSSYILFISHPWESRDKPDINDTQCNSVFYLLESAFQRDLSFTENYKSISLQGRLDIIGWVEECGNFDTFLEGIGIWYDNCCIPQEPFLLGDDLETLQVRILKKMDDFIVCATVIVLDGGISDYWNRAWCVMESTVAANYAISVFVESGDWDHILIDQDPRAPYGIDEIQV